MSPGLAEPVFVHRSAARLARKGSRGRGSRCWGLVVRMRSRVAFGREGDAGMRFGRSLGVAILCAWLGSCQQQAAGPAGAPPPPAVGVMAAQMKGVARSY